MKSFEIEIKLAFGFALDFKSILVYKKLMISMALYFIVSALDPNVVLKTADNFRSPEGAFSLLVDVKDLDEDSSSQFEVFIEDNDKSLMVTKEPARDRGRNLLMLDRDMWIFIPRIKRPVRVSLQQRLIGDVANGDLSRLRWTGDYEASFAQDESSKIKNGQMKLELKAAKSDLTYDKINLWVSGDDFRPLKAEYLTPSGKVLKTSEFSDFGPLAGSTRPRQITITDAINQDSRSVILIKEMNSREFPSGFFTQSNLENPRPRF